MEINVILHKVVETMPQQMRSEIKAKAVQWNIRVCDFLGSVS